MIMEIHSSYGVFVCEPMTLQAIDKSIPEPPLESQGTETAPDDEDQEQVPIFMD